MDNRIKQNENLGVNKLGKNIRKSPLHQPNFPNPTRQQPQPQVYNINKNDFRNVVQQLTGSPSRESISRPPHNPPKPPSMRLQKIRPPPLTPIHRPQIPIHHPAPAQLPPNPAESGFYGNGFGRPPAQFVQPSPMWASTAESPISAYMRYLQNSMTESGPTQTQPQTQPMYQSQPQPQPQASGQILEQPPSSTSHPTTAPPTLPSPRGGGFPLLPSPTSQFLLPSPGGFLNLFSPRSPYPLLSPGYQFPPPLTPNFAFSPLAQPGILGPGPQPPLSPGIAFPLSPGFFPNSSPRWSG